MPLVHLSRACRAQRSHEIVAEALGLCPQKDGLKGTVQDYAVGL